MIGGIIINELKNDSHAWILYIDKEDKLSEFKSMIHPYHALIQELFPSHLDTPLDIHVPIFNTWLALHAHKRNSPKLYLNELYRIPCRAGFFQVEWIEDSLLLKRYVSSLSTEKELFIFAILLTNHLARWMEKVASMIEETSLFELYKQKANLSYTNPTDAQFALFDQNQQLFMKAIVKNIYETNDLIQAVHQAIYQSTYIDELHPTYK